MSDQTLSPESGDSNGEFEISLAGKGSANLVYILYLVGVIIGLAALVGVILAYTNKGKYGAGLDTHFKFQIRTFWFGLLALIVGSLLSIIIIGWVLILAWVVWAIMRTITGMQLLGEGKALSNPDGLGFKAQ
ncbi:MAG: hypothetical protein PVF65_10395 [Sphingomonadales bacterium]|jgi:uncharacterized membrane protein